MAVDDPRPDAAHHADGVTAVHDLAGLEAALAATPPAVAPLRDERPYVPAGRFADAPWAEPPAAFVGPSPAAPPAPAPAPMLTVLADVPEVDRCGRPRYDCPGCGAAWLGEADAERGAKVFCPTCDFPLFWAVEGATARRRSHEAARRRHPGVDGRASLASMACRHCGEPNLPDPTADCVRCGEPLTPPPATAPPPAAEIVYVEVPVPPRPWQIATAVSGTMLFLATVALWWVAVR